MVEITWCDYPTVLLSSYGRDLGDHDIICVREVHVRLIFERSIKQLLDVNEICAVFVGWMEFGGRRKRQWLISSRLL